MESPTTQASFQSAFEMCKVLLSPLKALSFLHGGSSIENGEKYPCGWQDNPKQSAGH